MKSFAMLLFCVLLLPVAAQQNPAVVFDFDSVKVYTHYTDVLSVLKRENKLFGTTLRHTKNDSVYLHGSDLLLSDYGGNQVLDLEEELFRLVDGKRATISYKGKAVSSWETKKVKKVSNGRKEFVGLCYHDAATKKHLLTKTLYRRPEETPFPDF